MPENRDIYRLARANRLAVGPGGSACASELTREALYRAALEADTTPDEFLEAHEGLAETFGLGLR